jgi:pyruvate formate lyase activating enzyme
MLPRPFRLGGLRGAQAAIFEACDMESPFDSKALVFDIQSFSTHDGPGIRTNVFFKGCPLHCLWCSNPEGQKPAPELFYTKMKCVGCLCCAKACPHGAVSVVGDPAGLEKYGPVRHDRTQCDACQTHDCVPACYQEALAVSGAWMTVDEVMAKIRRDSVVYRNKGGITVSGGDPLYYYRFVAELLGRCQAEGINTVLESELSLPIRNLMAVVPYVDLYLADLKIVDERRHLQATGRGSRQTLENLRFLGQTCPEKVCLRVPIIPGCTDPDENIDAIGAFCRENRFPRVNILPYHKLGSTKHERLGSEYPMPAVPEPDDARMQHIAGIIRSHGVDCSIN